VPQRAGFFYPEFPFPARLPEKMQTPATADKTLETRRKITLSRSISLPVFDTLPP
jgi:hypothetical protein